VKKDRPRLGRGVENLFQEPSPKKPVEVAATKLEDVNLTILRQARSEATAKGSPVVGVWSVRAKTLLRYLVMTKPRFKESKEAAGLLEDGLRKKYPQIWAAIETLS